MDSENTSETRHPKLQSIYILEGIQKMEDDILQVTQRHGAHLIRCGPHMGIRWTCAPSMECHLMWCRFTWELRAGVHEEMKSMFCMKCIDMLW